MKIDINAVINIVVAVISLFGVGSVFIIVVKIHKKKVRKNNKVIIKNSDNNVINQDVSIREGDVNEKKRTNK